MIQLTDLRIKLNQMNERIISRFKDRSRFELNDVVYKSGSIPIEGRHGISFLEFSLEGLEAYHASLGRYYYPDQHPVYGKALSKPPVKREIQPATISPVNISLRDELIRFYIGILPELCKPGNDPSSYGETVYIDADLLEHLHERINVGRFVAESKLQTHPHIQNFVSDSIRLRQELKDVKQEENVIRHALECASKYELNSHVVEKVFRWVIGKTLQVEIDYLQKKYRIKS